MELGVSMLGPLPTWTHTCHLGKQEHVQHFGESPFLLCVLDAASWPWTVPTVVWDLPHADVATEAYLPACGKSLCLEGMIPVQNRREASSI